MKTMLNSRRNHYMARVSIFLIMAVLIAGVLGCGEVTPPVQYDLTISSSAGGSVTAPGEGTFTYDEGTDVNLVAKADEGYRFVRWTGDLNTIDDINAASTTIMMNGNYSITANFETIPPTQYSLTISSTAGGSVTMPGEGVFIYDEGTVVDLVAEAEESYHFINWTGDVSTVANISAVTTTIPMNDNYYVTANFEEIPPGQFGLTVTTTVGGSVTVPGEGTFAYDTGTVTNLVASPASGYYFVNWTGDVGTIVNVTSVSTTITMNGDYSITANFEELPEYNLTTSSTAGGSVTVPGEGTFTYYVGTVVNLVATPVTGYRFVNWTGNVGTIGNVTAASTTITMNSDYSISANFSVIPPLTYSLTISSTSGGSVTTPGEGIFARAAGTVVNLVATAASGYRFVNWTGNVGTIGNVNSASTTITMNDSYSITANFEEEEDAVVFPDPNLEAAIRAAIGKPTGTIYKSDLEGLTSLNAQCDSITNLSGLQYCTDLTHLWLNINQISDISLLTNLTNLTELFLHANEISDISPLANLTNLTQLSIGDNHISDISPLANLTSLTSLSLGGNLEYPNGNRISDISVLANLTNLTSLSISYNQVSDISPLASLTSLTSLVLAQNLISDISSLVNLTKLTLLGISGNEISDISVLANLTSLNFLAVSSNQITDISVLANLTNLTYLFLDRNQISDISPLVQNAGLGPGDKVYLTWNPLSSDSINIYIPQLQARGVTVSY